MLENDLVGTVNETPVVIGKSNGEIISDFQQKKKIIFLNRLKKFKRSVRSVARGRCDPVDSRERSATGSEPKAPIRRRRPVDSR